MNEQYRAPTVKEGADYIQNVLIIRESKISCVEFWRRLYGDELADQIISELKARKMKLKKEKSKNE